MCIRYRLKASADELIELFDLPRDAELPAIAAECFPGKPVPVIHQQCAARWHDGMT